MEADEIVAGWWGRMGSGKTLNMTKWGILLAEATNRPLYANYHINHPRAHYFEDFREIADSISHAIICWDEIMVDHDSRNSIRKDQTAIRQQEFTHWFCQTRKLYCSFLYTTQRLNTLEKRIRENTQYIFRCSKDKYFNCTYERLYDTAEGFELAHFLTQFTNDKPQLYYGLYNTHEVVKKSFFGA